MAYAKTKTYRVKLTRPVVFLGAKLLPLPFHEFSGAALNDLVAQEGSDVVDSAAVA